MDAKDALGEPVAVISRSALLHNVAVLRRALPPGVRMCAVVKADAYGHDANTVVDALYNFSADKSDRPAVDALAVADIDEAVKLSQIPLPTLVLRPVENAFLGRQRVKLEAAIRRGLILTLCSPAAAGDLARIAVAAGRRAAVQVMVDTGMNRSGVGTGQLDELIRKIECQPSLRLVGLCTHFANSENAESSFTSEQFTQFRRGTDAVAAWAGGRILRHAANSGAIFFAPQTALDMVRPGLALYGIDPGGRPHVDRSLRPVMKWTAPLILIRDIKKGESVGYGQTWTAPRDTRVGLVPVGYADGYPRVYSNRAMMLLDGRPAPVVGRVSMDLTTIDLGHHPQACIGDDVTLLDNDPLSPVSVYALAQWAGTIPYEIFCRIGPRVRRLGFDPADGREAGAADLTVDEKRAMDSWEE